MKTIWFKTSLALTISAVSTYTLANGIAINEQSASGAGTAYAGRASSALDASTIYGNPAGLSKLKRTEVSGGLAIVKAKDDISQAHSTAQGSNKGDSGTAGRRTVRLLLHADQRRFHFRPGHLRALRHHQRLRKRLHGQLPRLL
ncbi:outer membrane protein [Pseudomonas aeruginosa]|nr:outer membrane protein [Pseudomonas aeruginosa]